MSKKQFAILSGKVFVAEPVDALAPKQPEIIAAPIIKLPHWKEGEGYGAGVVINQKKGNQT